MILVYQLQYKPKLRAQNFNYLYFTCEFIGGRARPPPNYSFCIVAGLLAKFGFSTRITNILRLKHAKAF